MRLVVYGMFCVGLAGLHVYGEFDKRVNFQPIDARVSAVNEQCYMEKTEGLGSGKTWTSDLLPCELAELLTREHSKWQGYDVKHKIEVRFDYISPVDGATHASRLEMSAYPCGRHFSRPGFQGSGEQDARERLAGYVARAPCATA